MTFDEILKADGRAEIGNAAMKKVLEEVDSERTAKIGQVLKVAISSGRDSVEREVKRLRLLRKQEAVQTKKVESIGEAVKFMNASGNPFPLLRLIDPYEVARHLVAFGLDADDFPDTHEIWKVA